MAMDKKKNEVYVVNTCDAWQGYNSFRLVGVFTNRKSLNKVLNSLIQDENIAWKCNEEKPYRKVNSYSVDELMVDLEYVNINVVKLNEIQ